MCYQVLSGTHTVMNSPDIWDDAPLASTESEALTDPSDIYMNSSLLNISTSNTTNLTSMTYYPYYQHSLPVAASLTIAYLFIFLLCMVGNGLVCLIVLENRRMRTVTNLFIFNLAVSDLLVGVFCIPTTLVDNLITGNILLRILNITSPSNVGLCKELKKKTRCCAVIGK